MLQNLNKRSLKKLYGKSKLNFVRVPCTNLKKISFENINSNIKLSKYVFYAKGKNGNYIFAFSNGSYESELLNIVEELRLNAKYNYYINLGEQFIILKESIVNGRSSKTKESKLYPRKEYNIAKCLA